MTEIFEIIWDDQLVAGLLGAGNAILWSVALE